MRQVPQSIPLQSPPSLAYAIGFPLAFGFLFFISLCVFFCFRKRCLTLKDEEETDILYNEDDLNYYRTDDTPRGDYY